VNEDDHQAALHHQWELEQQEMDELELDNVG
jgi:hypothetical protein